jgi:tetratricopeptide (TPR) repeat protein
LWVSPAIADFQTTLIISRKLPMRHPELWRPQPAKLISLLAVFALTLGGSCSLPGQTADPPTSLTRQEQKLEAQASELFQAGYQAYEKADLATAIARIRESLGMLQALYPRERYPQGHADLAQALSWMGFLLQAQGSDGDARGYFERALTMRESLYPKERYPQGHPELAATLTWMGFVLEGQGSYSEARGYLERALAMYQSLYPKERYPQGHLHLAASLHNLGGLLQSLGSYDEARLLRTSAGDAGVAVPEGPLPPGPPRPGLEPEQPRQPAPCPGLVR